MSVLTCCSSLVCAGLLTLTGPRGETRDILPAANLGFTLEAKDGVHPMLLDLLTEYERATGIHLVLSWEVLSAASRSSAGVTKSLVVPQEKVHAVVESLIAEAGFRTVLIHAEEPVLLAVRTSRDAMSETRAVDVTGIDLSMVELHSALMCSTVLDLDALSGNDLSEARRSWNEKDIRSAVLLRNPQRVMLMGRGRDVASRARSLQALNDSARPKVEEAKKSDGGSIK